MWLKKEHYLDGGVSKAVKSLTWGYLEGVKLHHLLTKTNLKAEDFWHATRIVEYPMMLRHLPLPEKGSILDVGSNHQFPVGLMKAGDVTLAHDLWLHHTSHDVGSVGITYPPKYGAVPCEQAFRDTNGKWKMIFCDPGATDVLDDHFDVIYNVSVMEHVEPENCRRWMEGLWRWLKPGGRMMLSCDYALGLPLGDGRVGFLFNHDFSYVLDEFGGKLFAGTPSEIPWHSDFDPGTVPEAYELDWEDLKMSVYFWGVEKPS